MLTLLNEETQNVSSSQYHLTVAYLFPVHISRLTTIAAIHCWSPQDLYYTSLGAIQISVSATTYLTENVAKTKDVLPQISVMQTIESLTLLHKPKNLQFNI